MKKLFFLLLVLIANFCLLGQPYQVEMVANINPNTGSNPRWFTVWDTTMYFFANESVNGFKIYSLQPSGVPTLCPNLGVGTIYGDATTSTSKRMGVLNGKLYMQALIAPNGREMYAYDGINTPSLVMDINPGSANSSPSYFITYNNVLYFQATNATLGSELWSHNPITNTTQCLTDINPGSNPSSIAFITAYNNKLYFAASNGNDNTPGNTGVELYMYDPIANSTSLVMDINPGYLASNPYGLFVANGKLYFIASDPAYGKELYEYDGTTVTRLTDVNPGPGQGVYVSDHSYPTFFNGSIYFAANDSSNLINLGKYELNTNTLSILYCSGAGMNGNVRYFKVYDNKLFFNNSDTTFGEELWYYDGTNPPALAADIKPGQSGSNPMFMEVFNDELYFKASNDTSTSEELFRLKKVKNEEPSLLMNTSQIKSFTLYPNPTSGKVQLDFSLDQSTSIVTLEIYSMAGVLMERFTLPSKQKGTYKAQLELSNYPIGVYLLHLKDENSVRLTTCKLEKM